MTYNIGGGRKNFDAKIDDLIEVVSEIRPDLLGLQEAWESIDGDGYSVLVAQAMAKALGDFQVYFGPTISMREDFHVAKKAFIDAIFKDMQEWQLGNALVSRWDFLRLGQLERNGTPVNIPLYRPTSYRGTRDTDPRNVLITRIGCGPINPYVMVTHLTTILGERRGAIPALQGKTEEARQIRWRQAQALLDLIQTHILDQGHFAILLGDFNATAGEPCLENVLERDGRFMRLVPVPQLATHPKAATPIDHILIFPGAWMVESRCWVVDNPLTRRASDHLPVVADLRITARNGSPQIG